jgi:ABC-type lipoprotein export system ATPase subunit
MTEVTVNDQPIPLVLDGRDLCKDFTQGGTVLEVLRGASIAVRAGERIAIVGASGSGKTTLLQLLGGLDLPTRGAVRIAGAAMHELSDSERGELRNRAVGFVYQFHHLLPEFTALENVAMPLLVRRCARAMRGPRPRRYSRAWDWPGGWSTGPRSSPAGSASGPRLRARW